MIRRTCRAWKIVPTALTKLSVTLPLFSSLPKTNPFPRKQDVVFHGFRLEYPITV